MTKQIRHGLRAVLTPDDSPWDPRGDDNVTRIVTWRRRRDIGDQNDWKTPWDFLLELLGEDHPELREMDEGEREDMKLAETLGRFPYRGAIRPIFMYDHSGIVLNTSAFSCPWDSGWIGWTYITPENLDECQLDTPEKVESRRLQN